MIAKKLDAPNRTGRGSFGNSIDYAANRERDAVEFTECHGVTSVNTAAVEMSAQASLSKRCKDPVHHEVISYAKGEEPTRDQIKSDVERVLAARDMAGHQYVYAVHTDTGHKHIHVIANRIGPDGKANNTSMDHARVEKEVARISVERGWEVVNGKFNKEIANENAKDLAAKIDEKTPVRSLTDGDHKRLTKSGEMPWQEVARDKVLNAVDSAKSWADLHQKLSEHGIVAKHSVKTGKDGREYHGLSFAEGMGENAPGCAASRIDPEKCKYGALAARFGSFEERGAGKAEATATVRPLRDQAQGEGRPRQASDAEVMRGRYKEYREGLAAKTDLKKERLSEAWKREQGRRSDSVDKRRTELKRQKAMTALLPRDMRRGVNLMFQWNHRRKMDRDFANHRADWTQAKARIETEHRSQKPLSFREFVDGQAKRGDEAAQRLSAWMDRTTSGRREVEQAQTPQPIQSAEIRQPQAAPRTPPQIQQPPREQQKPTGMDAASIRARWAAERAAEQERPKGKPSLAEQVEAHKVAAQQRSQPEGGHKFVTEAERAKVKDWHDGVERRAGVEEGNRVRERERAKTAYDKAEKALQAHAGRQPEVKTGMFASLTGADKRSEEAYADWAAERAALTGQRDAARKSWEATAGDSFSTRSRVAAERRTEMASTYKQVSDIERRMEIERKAGNEAKEVVRDFQSAAIRREMGSPEWRDGGRRWEARPDVHKKAITEFNAMPKDVQERTLKAMEKQLTEQFVREPGAAQQMRQERERVNSRGQERGRGR